MNKFARLASHLLVVTLATSALLGCTRNITQDQMLAAFRTEQQTNFTGLQGQQAVPGEYIIRRKGAAYLDTPEAFAQKYNIRYIQSIDALAVELFQVSDPNVLQQMQADVEYAEPNYLRRATVPQQSGNTQISSYHAQSVRTYSDPTAGANNYIGLIDTGVDTTHPDLQGRLMPGKNMLGTAPMTDDNGHGTYMAGVAVGNNPEQQLAGVAPGSKIIPVKALDASGTGSDFAIAGGIVWAVEYGAKVVVVSALGAQQGNALSNAIQHATQRGVPVVTPAGNSLDPSAVYPATDRGVIAVNAVDPSGQRLSPFAAQGGNFVAISAVAQGVRSTFPTQPGFALSKMGMTPGYGMLETPGAAAMQVAAAIARIRSTQPSLQLPQLRQALQAASDDMGAPGPDAQFGLGRLNVARLVRGGVAAQSVARPYGAYAAPRYPVPYGR